ncbi:HPP family protein [Undibacterium sp. LX15W]|uniref:HPP family protein n=2 Tax=Undibacterium flavidum TaxID=2762297 RepID=A0ABR6YCH9_9BURK|nr:HPP family protein [Undibacterium flavidum]
MERLRASVGALLGILLTATISHQILGDTTELPFLIAPMGASAVLLFALPSSPLAQPWAILVGNSISAAVGVLSVTLLGSTPLAAAIAVAIATAAMFATRSLHPPGGAIALSAVIGGPAIHAQGFLFIISPVGINSLALLFLAIIFNNLTRHDYPHLPAERKNLHQTNDLLPGGRLGFASRDLDTVIKQYNEVLDISRDDLEFLFKQTQMHAYRRNFQQLTCADIMSRDTVSITYETSLEEAWNLLRKHKIKALPVIDDAHKVIGILTLIDFMKHANLDVYDEYEMKLRHLIQGAREATSGHIKVVGQIMTTSVFTAFADGHIVELVPLLSDAGMHHIPIVDENNHLIGMVTQSDLISGLYRAQLNGINSAPT